jgi:hypothetical protein
MNYSNKINSIIKQNDSIYSSLVSKNIIFERVNIPENISEDEYLNILNIENTKLKEIVKLNKPQPIPKKQEIKEVFKKEDKKENLEEDEEEIYDEPIKKYDTITNMEESKRAFFNGDYESFTQLVKQHELKYYRVNYKYNSDKDGAPDFSAKNLLKGFVRNFDDYRKYFMICFRCHKHEDNGIKYKYTSLWIVNTNEPINNIIGSLYDDFDFEEDHNLDNFINDLKKINLDDDNTNCIGESYVH